MDRGVRQLDLSNCGPGSVDSFVPGLRSSATFFSFLRANLVLTPSAVSSATNTPSLEPYRLPPSSPSPPPAPARLRLRPRPPPPLSAAAPSLVPIDDIPPLSLDTLTSRQDKAGGLRLVADSVAQMRPRAALVLARHPLCLALLAAAWAAVYGFAYRPRRADDAGPGAALVLAAAAAAAYLAGIRLATHGYGALARDIDASWLRDDVILGARCGDTLVGALVLHLEPPVSRRRTRGRGAGSLRAGRGVIRAWTTSLSHRGRGIGRDLLLAASRKTKERCGRDAQVGFASEHANSVLLLPALFAGPFRRDEIRAAKALDDAAAEWELRRKKKR